MLSKVKIIFIYFIIDKNNILNTKSKIKIDFKINLKL